jgi:hypothetical protein
MAVLDVQLQPRCADGWYLGGCLAGRQNECQGSLPGAGVPSRVVLVFMFGLLDPTTELLPPPSG